MQRPSGEGIQEQGGVWPGAVGVFVLVLSLLLIQSAALAQNKPTRRILILNEVNPSYPSITILNQAFQTALYDSPYRLEYYFEYFDTILFPDEATQQAFRDFYLRKYRNRRPDLIVTVGVAPLNFMQEVHQKVFPGVPIVFCLPVGSVPSARELGPNFTGVESDMAPAETLAIALRLQPGTEHVMVVGGVTKWDKFQETLLKQQITGLARHLDVTYLTNLEMPDLLERLKHLPPHTIVLLLSFAKDAKGTQFKSNEVGLLVAGAANAPVFTLYDVFLTHGEVGGYLSNLNQQGKVAGGMAERILRGENPQDVPRVKGVNTYMFDWRAVKRWGLKESEIPPGSIVLNRQPTVWEAYRSYFIGGISLIFLETLLIGGLLWQRARRKRVETDLALINEELRLALEVGKSVSWEWDEQKGLDRRFGDLQTMFGIPAQSYFGSGDDFRRSIHPEDRELVWNAVAEARESGNPYLAEFRIVRTDGTVRWVTSRGKFDYAKDGRPGRILGMAIDITDRKQAEQELNASEDRLAGIVGSAMDAIIAVDEERRIVLFNAAAEKIFGCTGDEALGTIIDRFIPERVRSQHEAQMRRFGESGVSSRQMGSSATLWAIRANGQEFPVDASITRLESEGRKLFTVTVRDITERRRAEEALAKVGRRLIEAHEEERTWIARELHDDINQRIAMLTIGLERWHKQLPGLAVESHHHIDRLRQGLLELAKDIQALSHRLHSSKLEYLGIVAAAKGFCRELSEQQKVEIEFSHTEIPENVPKEVSLCLFRVLQEALQNAVKHSGARQSAVELGASEGEIQLTVTDHGTGFDPHIAINGHGLGLISMRERLALVDGQISIESQPGSGTRIHARAPFSSRSDSNGRIG